MKRKLVKQGTSTLMVSLPSKWVKEKNLDKGAEVNLEIDNNQIIISSDKIEKQQKEIKMKITTSTESSIRTILTNLYRAGYGKITITFNHPRDLDIIKKTIHSSLLGFEIINSTEQECLIESITEPNEDQQENLMLKIFFSISELFNLVEKKLKGEKVDNIEDLENLIKKQDNFIRRTYSLYQTDDASEKTLFQSTLIHAQREIYFISKLTNVANEEVLNYFSKVRKLYDLLKKSYMKKDITLLEKLHEEEKELIIMDGYRLITKNSEQNIILFRLLSAARKFYLCASPLTTIIFNKS